MPKLVKIAFGTNLYQKLPILAISEAVSPHFQSHDDDIWCEGAELGLRPHAKFCFKKSFKWIGPLGGDL